MATAEEMNTAWDIVTTKLDAYWNGIPVDIRNTINKAISDWQDFYFGESGIWSAEGMAKWSGILAKTQETLAASIKPEAKPEPVPVATTQAPKTDSDPIFYIQGQVESPPIPDVVFPSFTDLLELRTPNWLIPLLIGIPGLFILYQATKSKKGRHA